MGSETKLARQKKAARKVAEKRSALSRVERLPSILPLGGTLAYPPLPQWFGKCPGILRFNRLQSVLGYSLFLSLGFDKCGGILADEEECAFSCVQITRTNHALNISHVVWPA